MAAELSRAATICLKSQSSTRKIVKTQAKLILHSRIRSSRSSDDQDRVYKQLGLFALKQKIEDAVSRAEMSAPTALELEEAIRIKQEEIIRNSNLWDDPIKSNEILVKLADSVKAVDALKDLKYKAEEAKLISHLAGMEAINYQLFEQAYSASLDVSKLLDQYEMSKLLKGSYDREGACVIIKAESEGINNETWAEELVTMYIRWAEKLGCKSRLVETHTSMNDSVSLATIEFEFECAYGYLCGERGLHHKINSQNGSYQHEVSSVSVDVIPLSLGTFFDLYISDDDLTISAASLFGEQKTLKQAVYVQHVPTGITVQSSGERSHFANKMKALNRLKAKLLVIAEEQKVDSVGSIKRGGVVDMRKEETRRYLCQPHRVVQDLKTGIHLPDLTSVLDGNIEPLIIAHINLRHAD